MATLVCHDCPCHAVDVTDALFGLTVVAILLFFAKCSDGGVEPAFVIARGGQKERPALHTILCKSSALETLYVSFDPDIPRDCLV